MLDEIREQRFLACHLRIEGVLIAGARSLHGAGLTGRGTRQLRPPPISSESLTIGGGWGAASGGGGGRSPSLRASIQLWGS